MLGKQIQQAITRPMLSNVRLPSFDTLALASIVTLTGTAVYSAHREGTLPLDTQEHSTKCQYKSSGKSNKSMTSRLNLTEELIRKLEQDGYIVIDNFLTPTELRRAALSAKLVEARRPPCGIILSKSDTAKSKPQLAAKFAGLRRDCICYFDDTYIGATEHAFMSKEDDTDDDTGLKVVRDLLRGVAYGLAQSSFQGFLQKGDARNMNDGYYKSKKSWIGVPQTVQLSHYSALPPREIIRQDTETTEASLSNYNHAHLDACTDKFVDQGLMGFLKSIYLRKRYITGILYLNSNLEDDDEVDHQHSGGKWQVSDGGYLRIFSTPSSEEDDKSDNKPTYVDVEPRGGRLILLSSVSTMHQVLPSYRSRSAATIWLTLN